MADRIWASCRYGVLECCLTWVRHLCLFSEYVCFTPYSHVLGTGTCNVQSCIRYMYIQSCIRHTGQSLHREGQYSIQYHTIFQGVTSYDSLGGELHLGVEFSRAPPYTQCNFSKIHVQCTHTYNVHTPHQTVSQEDLRLLKRFKI